MLVNSNPVIRLCPCGGMVDTPVLGTGASACRFDSCLGYVNDKERADLKRKAIADYKVEKGCVDCGYNAHHAALEFDHLPEYDKVKSVASLMYNSWEIIWAEIAKCEIVCSNCHSIRTFNRANA